MFIDEQDIFNYVKYPDKLMQEKKEYIKDHLDLFENELEFLNDAPEFDNSDLPSDIKLELHFKLLGKNPKRTVRLEKLASPTIQKNHIRNLAADSASTVSALKTVSFTDEFNSYLVKVLLNEDKTTIYIFSTDNKEMNNFSLCIKPSYEIHYIHSNKTPLIINNNLIIDSIEIFQF